MGKCMIIVLLVFCLLMPVALAQSGQEPLALEMHPGETMKAPEADAWASSDEGVAAVDDEGAIHALTEGICQIVCTSDDASVTYRLTVDDGVPTELIKKAIAIAQTEFETLDGQTIKKYNKYSKWYNNSKSGFGWCGAFVGWCFQESGVPMSRVGKAEKVGEDVTYAISEAAVGKILKGYQKMERTTSIPRPGYMVIYSVTGKSYNNIHTGLVAGVTDLGNGRYLLTTIEGNVSNTVKKYQYYYDSTEEAAKKMRNMEALPEEMQTDEKICYKLHSEDWYVKIFCQTYQ